MGFAPQADSFAPAHVETLLDFEAPDVAATPSSDLAGMPEFHETADAVIRRVALGTAYALRKRPAVIPHLMWMGAEFLASPARAQRRLAEPRYRGAQGLVAISEDLSPKALLDGYRRGMFPFCHVRPMKWWSPPFRAVLRPGESRVEKNIRRLIRQGKYHVTFDRDLAAVMRACAEPRDGKTPLTWVTPQVMRAYWRLHQEGHVHSVEVWNSEGQLVGGAYGLAVGNVYFGESQFSASRDASKIAIATLHCHLDNWGFALRDAKRMTGHLAGQGFHPVSRIEFMQELENHAWKPGRVGRWEVDPSLDVAGWNREK
jgi:leucyl/phenylalanyl-tRNA--protein transferase